METLEDGEAEFHQVSELKLALFVCCLTVVCLSVCLFVFLCVCVYVRRFLSVCVCVSFFVGCSLGVVGLRFEGWGRTIQAVEALTFNGLTVGLGRLSSEACDCDSSGGLVPENSGCPDVNHAWSTNL